MKRLLTALLCTAMVLTLPGCAKPDLQPVPSSEEHITFTDDLGREVSLPKPERTAALIGSFAEVWCLAGGEDTLVAAAHDSWTQFDLGLSDQVADLGAIKEPNVELLLASEPDLVLGSTKTTADVELKGLLEQAGIPVAYFDVSSFSDYLRMLELCTRLTGQPDRYETYGTAIQDQVEAAIAKADGSRPSALYIRATGKSCKVKNSQDTVLGEMLADLDCVNIADNKTALLENLSMETIMVTDPDHIFIVLQGSDPSRAQATLENALLSNPAWEGLTAVKEGRLHFMDQTLYSLKPNAKWGDAYENLAKILYPEAF